QAGDYTVVVANEGGAVTSQVATLTLFVPALLTPLAQRWRFNESGAGLGTTWEEVSYDDSSLANGGAMVFQETVGPASPQGILLARTNDSGQRIITYYFRTHFTFSNAVSGVWLLSTNYVQDGAVFYLNGVELSRLRLPGGRVTASTIAFVGPHGQPDVLLLRS